MFDQGSEGVVIRRASVADAPAVLQVFDEVIVWFVTRGNHGQWGTEPWSASPRRVAQVTDACAMPGAWVAQDSSGQVLAALVLGEPMAYVPAAAEPEVYVRLARTGYWSAPHGVRRRPCPCCGSEAFACGLLRRRDRRSGSVL